MSTLVGALVGDGVTLRPGARADVDALFAIRTEPSVWAWWRDPTRAEIGAGLDGVDGELLLVIESSGVVVGGIQFHEETTPDYRQPRHHGRARMNCAHVETGPSGRAGHPRDPSG